MIVAFIDTNALLQYPPLKDVDWCKVCGESDVTIMLCQPVVRELDKHKSNARLSDRARARSREIKEKMSSEIRPGVTIRFYSDPIRFADFPDTLSPDSIDDQIVYCALQYKQKHGGKVAVITEDTLMGFRSEGHNVPAFAPPEHQRMQNPQTEDQKKLKVAEAALADFTNRLPKLGVRIEPSTVQLTKPIIPDPKKFLVDLHEKVINENPRLHASAHRLRPYFQQLELWLIQQQQVKDESARTIKVEATLHNTGRAPAKGVDLWIKFPDAVVAIWHDRLPTGNRLWKVSQPLPQAPGFEVELPEVSKPYPAEMSMSYTRPPIIGEIDRNTFHVFYDVFPHDEEKQFIPFYVTLGRWEDVTSLPIDVRIRTNDPADLHEFQVQVDVTVEHEH